MVQLFTEQLKHLTGVRSGNELSEKTFLLAVSGGRDSMCMAHLFLQSNLKFSIAHVNFSLRDQESDGDESLVRNWASLNRIDFFTTRFNTNEYAVQKSISIQMAARELRYNWFDNLMQHHSFDFLSIAHNLNDSAETLMINLLRGTGIKGITGINERNGYIIRPMLKFSRNEISDYVCKNKIPYRDDSSNDKSYYSRNRIRNNIFPEFEKINKSFLKTLERDINNFSDVTAILDDLKSGILSKVTISGKNPELKIDIQKLKKEKFASYWIYNILEDYGFNFSQTEEILDSTDGISGKKFESHTHILVKDRQYLLLFRKEENLNLFYNEIITLNEFLNETKVEFNSIKLSFKRYPKPIGFLTSSLPNIHYLDASRIQYPIVIRSWSSGDKFMPLGMNKFKKVSDFYIDLKIDVITKKSGLVIMTDGQIVCLPGLRIDNRYKVVEETSEILEISIC